MAIYPIVTLKTRVNYYIKQNGRQEITGNMLQGIIHDIIDSIVALVPPDPVTGIFTAAMLDGNSSITITHNLGTLTPDVTLVDPDGIQIFEMNSIIQSPTVNTLKFTVIGAKTVGNYSYNIKLK